MMFLVVCADVFCVQSFCARKLIVYLNCSALPLAAECVDECELKLWSVECAFAGLDFVLKSCCVACIAQCFFCVLPCCEIADVVFRHCAEFNKEVVESEIVVHAFKKVAELLDFRANLLFGAKNMSIVLNKAADAHCAVECSARLVADAVSELSESHRQVFV